MNLNDWNYGCLYGKDYDLNKELFPDPNKVYDIIFFLNLQDEDRRVSSSVEGVFAYNKPFDDANKDSSTSEKIFRIKRSEMKEFAKKFDGEFIPRKCGKK